MILRTVVFVSLLVFSFAAEAVTGLQSQSRDASHDTWVRATAEEMGRIKPGMTRADVLKLFAFQAPLSTESRGVFVSLACPYFKIEVLFASAANLPHPNMNDVIVSVSRPYIDTRLLIEWP